MRGFGIFLIVAGVIWAVIAFNMSTTITTDSERIGSGEFSTFVPSQTVHNLGLMEERRNHLMASGVTLLAGVILFGFGTMSLRSGTTAGTLKPCPLCAEQIQSAAMKCRFCGADLPDSFRAQLQPMRNAALPDNRLRQLIARIEQGYASYDEYAEAIGLVGGSIEPKGFFLNMHYVISLDKTQSRVDTFDDLRQWFLDNVAPRAGD